mmetsp:Transcript_22805/g.70662  ORF Transcript_22805/g.70662 Transcript_22805/m.70662 type:complete len:199 (+) Transcript_22805:81-677(+)
MRLLARSRGLAAGPGARHLSARKRPRKGSKAWLDRHVNDGFVKAAQKQGWRSRAAFKLLEMHEKHGLLAPGATIVELGCAPGGWTQVAASKLGPGGLVVGIDLLEVAALSGGNSRIIQVQDGDETQAPLTPTPGDTSTHKPQQFTTKGRLHRGGSAREATGAARGARGRPSPLGHGTGEACLGWVWLVWASLWETRGS